MSFLGKIRSAVMGNPVTREYEIGKHIASAGPCLLWKVHHGIKKSTRQEVSIFIFDKKSTEVEKIPKKHREAVLTMLRKGPTQLIRLKHPRLLTIEHQLEESNDNLMFVTEPLMGSLANVLGHYENVPTPLPLSLKEYVLHMIEIQYGILQLAEGLDFLHSDAKMHHGNITPESVVITSKGVWKLMGFNFSSFSQYQSEAQLSFEFREWNTRSSVFTNPSLDYLAPEYILSKTCSQASDIFSFGMLCFAVYNEGRPLFRNHNNVLSFNQNAEQISRMTESSLGKVPAGFKHTVRSMLAIEPTVRPDPLQISKDKFFEEPGVSTLKYMDMLYQRGDMEKSQFFKKNLARTLRLLPQRIIHQRVLPALAEEFRNHKMVPFVLPLVLLIAEDCSIQDFEALIMPILTQALKIKEPVQVPLILLQKMDQILKRTSQENVKAHILPMIITSLEAENGQLQELCVSILPKFASMVDYSSMKHSIIPRITALILSSKEPSLVINSLVCLGQMLDILDKHIVLDVVFPTLENISLREPGVLMAMLGIFHETLKNKKMGIDKTMLATRVIPFLIPLSIEPTLNVNQFNQFVLVIREMLTKVENEHHVYLDQLSKMEEQTKSTVEFAREVAEQKAMDDTIDKIEDIFGSEKSKDIVAKKGSSIPASTWTINSSTKTEGKNDALAGLSSIQLVPSVSSTSSTDLITDKKEKSSFDTWGSPISLVSSKPSSNVYTPPAIHRSTDSKPTQNLSLTGLPENYRMAKHEPPPPVASGSLFSGMNMTQAPQVSHNNIQSKNSSDLLSGTQVDVLQPTNHSLLSGGILQPMVSSNQPSGMKSSILQPEPSYQQHTHGSQDRMFSGMFSGMQGTSTSSGLMQQPLVPMQGSSTTGSNLMGWSSTIGGTVSNSGSGWSASGTAGTGWSQFPSSSNQAIPPGTGMGYGQSSMKYPSTKTNQGQLQMSKPNPFADLSFLG